MMTYQQYHDMVEMWNLGWNTFDIALVLNLREAEVAHRISTHLHHKRAKVAA